MFEILSRSLGALFELAFVAIPALFVFVSIAALIRMVIGKTAITISIPNNTYKTLKQEAKKHRVPYRRFIEIVLMSVCDNIKKQSAEPPPPPMASPQPAPTPKPSPTLTSQSVMEYIFQKDE